jgi:ATP-dependent DNA ligase
VSPTGLTKTIFLAAARTDLPEVEGPSASGGPFRLVSAARLGALDDDRQALWEGVCEHELEGVVAKRRSGRYLPGERVWIKVKNRSYWRYETLR